MAEERDEDGVVLAVYEHSQELGPLRPAHGTTPLQERFFIGDGQDSTRQLLDATGAVKDTILLWHTVILLSIRRVPQSLLYERT